MMTPDPNIELLGLPFWQTNMPLVDIVQSYVPESSNADYPHDNTPRAQGVDTIDALEKEPVHKAKRKQQANIHNEPKPALKLGASQHGDADHACGCEGPESNEWIWKPKDSSLFTLHNVTAADNWIEITGRNVVRVAQNTKVIE